MRKSKIITLFILSIFTITLTITGCISAPQEKPAAPETSPAEETLETEETQLKPEEPNQKSAETQQELPEQKTPEESEKASETKTESTEHKESSQTQPEPPAESKESLEPEKSEKSSEEPKISPEKQTEQETSEKLPEEFPEEQPAKPALQPVSRKLSGKPVKSAEQLYNFFMENNPDADPELISYLSVTYIEEAAMESINSDIAWIQMCHETDFLRFGGLVVPEQNNFCGLGAINAEQTGAWFETKQLGVRAHIQHLQAYAYTSETDLVNECIDPRYHRVLPRGKSPDIKGLTGTWAADKLYDQKLEGLIIRLEKF